MREVFPISLVYAYIYGEDLPDNVSIDELENNPEFMVNVLRMSKDSKMYDLCSDNVKCNSKFVEFIVDNFKNNPDFVLNVVDYYYDHTQERELIFFEIMVKLVENYKFDTYSFKLYTVYAEERVRLSSYRNSLDSEEFIDEFGLGFIVLEHTYGESEILLNYLIKCLLNEVLLDDMAMSFEQLIHSKFKDPKKLESYGIRNFLIDYIRSLDIYLADYLCVHPELLNIYVKKVKSIFKRWDIYLENLNTQRELIIYQAISEFEKNNYNACIPTMQILLELIHKKRLEKYLDTVILVGQAKDIPFDEEYDYDDNFINRRFRQMLSQLLDELYSCDYIPLNGSCDEFDIPSGNVLYLK